MAGTGPEARRVLSRSNPGFGMPRTEADRSPRRFSVAPPHTSATDHTQAMKSVLILVAAMAAISCEREVTEGLEATLRLELIGQYGSRDGALALQSIRHISVHPSGERVYLTQNGVASVLVLSSSGDSLHVLGRAGDGPGEFRVPGPPQVWNDTVWVPDYSGPLSAFDASGEYLDALRPDQVRIPGSAIPPAMVGFLEDGSLLLEGGINIGRAAAGDQTEVPLVRVERFGDGTKTLGHRSIKGGFVTLSLESGQMHVGPHPAPTWDLRCADPHGRWLVTAVQNVTGPRRAEIRLTWISSSGDTLRSHLVETPTIGNETAKSMWEEEFAESFELPIGQVQRLSERLVWPTYLPAKELVCDHEGRAWVQLPHSNPDSATWVLHDATGEFFGSVVTAAEVQIKAAVGDTVWGWGPGDFDEPYVLRLQLVGDE